MSRQHDHSHGHTHGAVDPSIATTEHGIWAVKWSFVGLSITALLQVFVVWLSGSVALLADTIHNFGDAATALPLWVAFLLARRPPSRRFPFGYGKAEDLAGVAVVLIILFSAVVAGYQAVDRLLNPEPIRLLWAVAVASLIGFVGNEAVAVFRIRVGRRHRQRRARRRRLPREDRRMDEPGGPLRGRRGVDRLPARRSHRRPAHHRRHPRDGLAVWQGRLHAPFGRSGA